MFRCTSKLDIEKDEAVYLEEFASENELEARKEARADPDQLVIDPNSDTEEQDGQEGGDNDQCWFYRVLGAVEIAVGLFQRAHKDELNNIIE